MVDEIVATSIPFPVLVLLAGIQNEAKRNPDAWVPIAPLMEFVSRMTDKDEVLQVVNSARQEDCVEVSRDGNNIRLTILGQSKIEHFRGPQ